MNLDVTNWKEFKVIDLFDVKGTITTPIDILETGPLKYPYVTTQSSNNGVRDFFSTFTEDGNVITIDSAVAGFASYQEESFAASDHVEKLIPKFNMTRNIALFIVTILNQEQYRYSYGRKDNQKNIKNTVLRLPIDALGNPNWSHIENYMNSLKNKPITTSNSKCSEFLNTSSWQEFELGSIFDIKKGKRLTKAEQTEGKTLYIGAIDSNNGVTNYIGQEAIHEGNTISLSYNGSVGEAFYQPEPFWATDDVNVLYFKKSNKNEFNKYIALFICTILRQEKYRYSYGRKWVLENMRSTKIKLPIKRNTNNEYEPDWNFMENYIKALPYGDRI